MSIDTSQFLTPEQIDTLLYTLEKRFRNNMIRHPEMIWEDVYKRLNFNSQKLNSIYQMEQTGGEPDVISSVNRDGKLVFMDCSVESPAGRRSLCFDGEALAARKENKPIGSALDMATDMGINLLNEQEYRYLQTFGDFDTKTSSWIQTPAEIRKLGGALFGDKRYDHVFIYHNGAQSYYAARGFRGKVEL